MAELNIGNVVHRRELVNIHGNPVPDSERLVHLQFRRYAGCPACNVHLRSIARRHDEILATGIREIVVFHSKRETMLEFQGELPFAAVADPEKRLYAEFGIGKMSPLSRHGQG
jgi:peroxiredoxin